MRSEIFKLEREELLETVKEGEVFEVKEYFLPRTCYYVLGRAYAMSKNFPKDERIKSDKGKVLGVEKTPKGFYVTVGFDE